MRLPGFLLLLVVVRSVMVSDGSRLNMADGPTRVTPSGRVTTKVASEPFFYGPGPPFVSTFVVELRATMNYRLPIRLEVYQGADGIGSSEFLIPPVAEHTATIKVWITATIPARTKPTPYQYLLRWGGEKVPVPLHVAPLDIVSMSVDGVPLGVGDFPKCCTWMTK